MLIYCNQLQIIDEDAFVKVINCIIRWLKAKTKYQFSINQLLSNGDYTVNNMKVRTYNGAGHYPKLYSIMHSQRDEQVYGRQWITEIGIRIDPPEPLYFTLMLETSDVSTRVQQAPISTRPLLIDYIRKTCTLPKTTVGLKLKKLNSDKFHLRALQSEFETPNRTYPLVLVSRTFDGEPYINPYKLQNQLLGLAQVVLCEKDFDTYEMERVLSRRYSAWGGAINIIYPLMQRDYCRNNLLLVARLEQLVKEDKKLTNEILSYVTHFSNAKRKSFHFSPYNVRSKRLKESRDHIREKLAQMQIDDELGEMLEQALEHMSEMEKSQEETQKSLTEDLLSEQLQVLDLEESIKEKDHHIQKLQYHLEQKSVEPLGEQPACPVESETVFEAIGNPNPETLLNLVASVFPKRVVVLGSAMRSAKQSSSFQQNRRLASLLYRLCSEYFDQISEGSDSQAKTVFTRSEFAAKESESVMRSEKCKALRTFQYNGKDLQMFRHLKIGVSDNVQDTIRVHFHWLNEEKRIIVGHCGPHLPLE